MGSGGIKETWKREKVKANERVAKVPQKVERTARDLEGSDTAEPTRGHPPRKVGVCQAATRNRPKAKKPIKGRNSAARSQGTKERLSGEGGNGERGLFGFWWKSQG